MRKYIFILLPILVLLFGNVSLAYNQDDLTKLNTVFRQKYNRDLNTSIATQILNKWEEVKDTKPYGYIMTNNSTDFFSVFSSNVISLNGSSVQVSAQLISNWFYSDSTNRTLSWSEATATYNGNTSLSLGSWSEFHVIPIDWDHPYYSVAIPTPEYDVTYRKVGLDVDVPLNFNFNAPLDGEYYVEIMAEFALADYLTFMPVSRYFEASSYSYVTKEIVNPVQYVFASELTANTLHTVLTNMWQAALSEVPLSSVSIKFPTDFTAQEILDWRSGYDELRETCGTAGTSIKFYARYFKIVDDTKFVVGPWRIWNSVSPKTFNDELPSYYLPYAIASGNSGTSTSTSSDPDDVYIPVGGDNPTGEYYSPSFNITVGNNVPNYPDYPTIATYNLDNMLVSTMNNAKGLTSFFGEFGGFLTASFAFIPSWIWAIIGVGFSLSIVVMFLKIL